MQLNEVVIPAFEEDMSYHDQMALIIAKNNHDVVIEAANPLGLAPVYSILEEKYGWRGKYVTINPGHRGQTLGGSWVQYAKPEDLRAFLESPDYPLIHTRGDGRDNEIISAILDITKPRNPAYEVDRAIGIVLMSDEGDKWVPANATQDELIRTTAKVWVENLTKTNLKRLYMSDHVTLDGEAFVYRRYRQNKRKSSRERGKLYASPITDSEINEATYRLWCEELNNNGWNTEEVEFNKCPSSRRVLIVAHR